METNNYKLNVKLLDKDLNVFDKKCPVSASPPKRKFQEKRSLFLQVEDCKRKRIPAEQDSSLRYIGKVHMQIRNFAMEFKLAAMAVKQKTYLSYNDRKSRTRQTSN